jgi:hypothetical protein
LQTRASLFGAPAQSSIFFNLRIPPEGPRALQLRSYLILLVIAAVLPVVIFGGYLSYRS